MKGGPLSAAQRQRLQGFVEERPRLGPETVHIDLINACNLDCATCWNYAPGLTTPKDAAWKAQRMDSATFHRVLSEVAASGAERIILSGGGEPFMHPAIHDFIAAVKARGLALTVISNGTLCDFDRLAELGVDQMLINTSSASAATYVAYHPNQDEEAFARLVAGVASVQGRIAINLVQVINALNAHEIVAMVELADRVGGRASFKLGDTPPGTEACALSAGQRETLLADAIPAARQLAERRRVKHNLDAFADQLAAQAATRGAATKQWVTPTATPWPPREPAPTPGGSGCSKPAAPPPRAEAAPPPCFAGYLYSRVCVDGRVFFCCEHIEVGHVGHGDDASFATVWQAPPYDAVRRRIHEGDMFPGCARCGKHDMNFTAARQLARLQAEQAAQQ